MSVSIIRVYIKCYNLLNVFKKKISLATYKQKILISISKIIIYIIVISKTFVWFYSSLDILKAQIIHKLFSFFN
jgi:hypothetical protein